MDDHLAAWSGDRAAVLVATAVRNRSAAYRDALASAGLSGTAGLTGLLTAARGGNRNWLRSRGRAARPELLAALAHVTALQDVAPEDASDALDLFELVRTALGGRAIPVRHRAVHVQLALLAGQDRLARLLLRRYQRMDRAVRREVAIDLANPCRGTGGDERSWLRRLAAVVPGIGLDDRAGLTPFDRLRPATSPEPVVRPEQITVVVTAYRPDEGLLTAVRSITGQSWRNLEVLIVDDASPPGFGEVLARAEALDPRVRVLRQETNAGTYVARNAGLDAAAGEFVTFQDSDDWSHPRRLELQVAPLLADPGLVASTSDGRRVTPELTLTRLGRRGGRLNPSSLLVRRDAVLAGAGYLDVVRKGADSEYIDRIQAAFGPRASHHIDAHLALIRLSAGSLSRAEVLPHWIHPARAVYRSGYALWHRRIAEGAVAAHRPRDGGDRPFPAPAHLLRPSGEEFPIAAYDVVVAADFRRPGATQRSALAEIGALLRSGRSVAVLHLEEWRWPARKRFGMHTGVQELVNAGRIGAVALTDRVEAGLLIVREPGVLQFAPDGEVRLCPRTIMILADQGPGAADGSVRRWEAGDCTASAERMFGVAPVWCPQDRVVRTALLRQAPDLVLTDYDLPTAVPLDPVPPRRPRIPRIPVIGTDLTDPGALAIFAELRRVDVRIRLTEGIPAPVQPPGRLIFPAAELDDRTFLGQLDFYLHFGSGAAPVHRPALDAAAQGCLVVMPERYAAGHGETAVYCAPDQVGELLRRFGADRTLAVEQRRRARQAIEKEYHPDRFADRVAGLLREPWPVPPSPRVRSA
ncbi:glycosyltransferase [Actinoplanes sp. NPDC051851]|uniref:glycosyltransferase n=1 Tax=Actinoplanes sp. NPDC051851 TaxID=3154753 RepID=UPI00343CB7CA